MSSTDDHSLPREHRKALISRFYEQLKALPAEGEVRGFIVRVSRPFILEYESPGTLRRLGIASSSLFAVSRLDLSHLLLIQSLITTDLSAAEYLVTPEKVYTAKNTPLRLLIEPVAILPDLRQFVLTPAELLQFKRSG